jgi:hypothetical protein
MMVHWILLIYIYGCILNSETLSKHLSNNLVYNDVVWKNEIWISKKKYIYIWSHVICNDIPTFEQVKFKDFIPIPGTSYDQGGKSEFCSHEDFNGRTQTRFNSKLFVLTEYCIQVLWMNTIFWKSCHLMEFITHCYLSIFDVQHWTLHTNNKHTL